MQSRNITLTELDATWCLVVDFSAAKTMSVTEASPRRGLIVVDGVLENGGWGGDKMSGYLHSVLAAWTRTVWERQDGVVRLRSVTANHN